MTNEDAYAYFRTVRGQKKDHARNSVRRLRELFNSTGKRNSPEQQLSKNFWFPVGWHAEAEDAKFSIPGSELELKEAESFGHTPPETTETPDPELEITPEMTKSDNAADALAAMIAPSLVGLIKTEMKKAVDAMAPVKQLVVLRDKTETTIEGTAHESAPKVLQLVNQGLNVMLVGPAGCGKTMLAETVAMALARPLTMISCSAGMSEAQLLGRLLPLGEGGSFKYVESPFMRAYANGGVILLDEMDAADANLLLVINAALANGGLTVEARAASHDNTYVKRHADTVIIAATNTWGHGADTQYIGRGALDVSTLDRFYRVAVGYDAALEAQLGSKAVVARVQEIRGKVANLKIRRVVSTRMISRVTRAMAAGLTQSEAFADELASWTADERAKVGA